MGRKKLADKPLTSDMVRFIQLEANGYTTRECIKELFGLEEKDDPKEFHNYECKMAKWRKHPAYLQVWKEELNNISISLMNMSLKRIRAQIDSQKDGWLANKAANDSINFAKARLFADEDKSVTVRIEGMPDIGSPDGEE